MPHTLNRTPLTWRVAAAAAVVVGAGLLAGSGFARPDDETPPADKKADAPPTFDPKDVRVGPPAELAALRAAVEAAARKGENVDEIRKQLDALEKALAGKAWVKPKPVEEPPPPAVASPAPPRVARPLPFPGGLPQIQPGAFPGGLGMGQPDLDTIVKAQELLLRAAELTVKDPVGNQAEVLRLRAEAQELMTNALGGAAGRGLLLPGMGNLLPPAGGNGRLGVKIELVPANLADKIDLPDGRGILVADVVAGSVAEKAGLKPDDVLMEFAGQPVTDEPAAFVRMVQAAKAGEKLDIVVLRDGKKETIQGVELPAAAPAGRRMFEVRPLFGSGGQVRGNPAAAPADGKKDSVDVKVVNGTFTITAVDGGVKYVMVGPADGGKPVPSKVTVTDGSKTIEENTVDKLPAAYREKAKKVLAGVKLEK